ncbi:MAG: glycosyltransferase [Candidatus Bathyarchaeia archaeon]|jgi:glycosyltransferase involved in cell wall biosynthesis
MYYYAWYGYNPSKKMELKAPTIQGTKEISVVIPVRNNQIGISRFLLTFFNKCMSTSLPREVIIVRDHGTPITVPEECRTYGTEVKVLDSEGTGPASARNFGYRNAKGNWILFTDSDCIPSSTLLDGYIRASNGSVGYAGAVASFGKDIISRYYESQSILVPSATYNNNVYSPDYLITANSLVWKDAFELVGGFDEEIQIAAGEDVDLGFRLREIGQLSFAPTSVVFHDFDNGLVGFVKRFIRYGSGNRQLAKRYSLAIKPRPFKPANNNFANAMLASLQYLSMLWGWQSSNKFTHNRYNGLKNRG